MRSTPLFSSNQRSAIIIVAACGFADGKHGMTEASTTDKASTFLTDNRGSTTDDASVPSLHDPAG